MRVNKKADDANRRGVKGLRAGVFDAFLLHFSVNLAKQIA